jgi:hypothetical protein
MMRAMRAAIFAQRSAGMKLDPKLTRNLLGRRLDARQSLRLVFDDQAPAGGNSAGRKDATVLDQRELRRAAADINVEQHSIVSARERHGARAMGRHLTFHVMAGRSADKSTRLIGKQFRDGAGVTAFQCFAGQNDRAAVHLFAVDAGIGVTAADEARKLIDVNRVVGPIGSEQDGRLPENFTADHDEAARQRSRKALEVHVGEHQVGGRRADIDTHGGELDIIRRPCDLVDRGILRVDVQVLEFQIVHGICC